MHVTRVLASLDTYTRYKSRRDFFPQTQRLAFSRSPLLIQNQLGNLSEGVCCLNPFRLQFRYGDEPLKIQYNITQAGEWAGFIIGGTHVLLLASDDPPDPHTNRRRGLTIDKTKTTRKKVQHIYFLSTQEQHRARHHPRVSQREKASSAGREPLLGGGTYQQQPLSLLDNIVVWYTLQIQTVFVSDVCCLLMQYQLQDCLLLLCISYTQRLKQTLANTQYYLAAMKNNKLNQHA